MRRYILSMAAVLALAIGLIAVCDRAIDPAASTVLVSNEYGHGSGAVVGPDMVLTAGHVARNEGLYVTTQDGDAPRKVVRTVMDPDSDAAILYVDPPFDSNEPALPVDAAPLRVGDAIRVVGTPPDSNLMNCVLPGTVVKTKFNIPALGEKNLVVTDAHGARGCSGGPVVDARGRIRAINVVGCGTAPLVGELPASEFKGDLGL